MIESFDQDLITQLFQNNDTSVYKLDLILQQYSEYNSNSSSFVVDLNTFFNKNINNYTLMQESLDDINNLVLKPYTTDKVIKIDRSPLNSINIATKTLAIDITYNDLQNKSAFTNTQNPNAALNTFNALINDPNINNCKGSVFYDNYCNNYMLNLLILTCSNKFLNNQLLDASFLQNYTNSKTNPDDLVSAINQIKNYFTNTFNNLANLLQIQLDKIIASYETLHVNLIFDLNPGNDKFSNQLFYKIKNAMVLSTMEVYNNIINSTSYIDMSILILPYDSKLQKFTLNTYNANLLYTQMAVDLFIKSSYPIVHFCLINSLIKQYKIRGDFVNIRLGFLAKLNYTYKIANKIEDLSNATSKFITSSINNYFLALKDLTPTNLNNKLKAVHDLSNQVQDISHNINDLTVKTDNDKIVLKNIIVNNKVLEKRLWWRKFWFWFLFWFVLIKLILFFISIILYSVFLKNNQNVSSERLKMIYLFDCIFMLSVLLLIIIIRFFINLIKK